MELPEHSTGLIVNETIACVEDSDVVAQVVGYTAGALIAVLNVPLAFETWKTRSVATLVWATLGLHLAAGLLFLVYGILIEQAPMYVSNGIYIATTLFLSVCKVKFGSEPRQKEQCQQQAGQVSKIWQEYESSALPGKKIATIV